MDSEVKKKSTNLAIGLLSRQGRVMLTRRRPKSMDTQGWFTKIANGATESRKLAPQRGAA
jgi:hypothetical protein